MNLYEIEFSKLYEYSTLESGITISVLLKYSTEKVDFEAKIDTGSSHSIFSREFGENLGLEIENGQLENFGTAVGPFPAYGHEVTINVLDIETVSTVYFAKNEFFDSNVLGRQGWLDRVKFGLIDYEGKLFLSEYE
jgi:hypothetical protein